MSRLSFVSLKVDGLPGRKEASVLLLASVGLIGTNGLEHQDLIVGFLAHTGLTLDPEPPTQPTVLR
jgi:hypothetical protein